MTTTRKSVSGAAVAEAINTLNSRIEKTESDFIGHLQKVEDRLDQIIDLTRTVAVLQQQSTQQTDQISEIRSQLRENAQKFENSISRIHTRLDEISNHQRDKLELYSKEVKIEVDSVKAKAEATDKELKAWLNRGWGAWVVFVLVVGTVQAGFYRWVDGIEKEKAASVQIIKELSQFKDKQEIVVKQHDTDLTELKSIQKKSIEAQRDLEDLVSRRMIRK